MRRSRGEGKLAVTESGLVILKATWQANIRNVEAKTVKKKPEKRGQEE
jgi:hypothetical protein